MRTVNSNQMSNLHGVTKKPRLLQTSTCEGMVVLSKWSRLSLKQILLEGREEENAQMFDYAQNEKE